MNVCSCMHSIGQISFVWEIALFTTHNKKRTTLYKQRVIFKGTYKIHTLVIIPINAFQMYFLHLCYIQINLWVYVCNVYFFNWVYCYEREVKLEQVCQRKHSQYRSIGFGCVILLTNNKQSKALTFQKFHISIFFLVYLVIIVSVYFRISKCITLKMILAF